MLIVVARLLACPFCRELSPASEPQRVCPNCDVELVAMEELPPSWEAQIEAGLPPEVPPEDRRLPWIYFGRGRGPLLVLSILGLVAFFLPWVHLIRPELAQWSGFDLARGRAGWLWAGAVAWLVMIPLVVTRRSIRQLRGVRVICSVFAAMTLGEVGMLLALPPSGSGYVPVHYSWGWGLYASGLISLAALVFALRLGGRMDDIRSLPWTDEQGRPYNESSDGETLH